jgi:hypothetical protein
VYPILHHRFVHRATNLTPHYCLMFMVSCMS